MVDTIRLRTHIEERGIKLGYIAYAMGVSCGTLRNKLNSETDFKVSEAEKLAALLNLTQEERDACFFAPMSWRAGGKGALR